MTHFNQRDFACLIPAKGESKRIPQKNIKTFISKPILHYPIESALNTHIFDDVFVYTHSKSVMKSVENFPVKVELEPVKDDPGRNLTTILKEFTEKYHNKYKYICLMMPTSIFATPNHLKEGLKKIIQNEYQTVFAAKNLNVPITRAFQISDDNRQTIEMIYKDNRYKFTNEIKDSYFDAGQMYWIDVQKFIDNPHIFNEDTGFIEINHAIDIDTQTDWDMAEVMYKFNRHNESEDFFKELLQAKTPPRERK